MTTPATLSTATPYVGPRAFDEDDQGIFFGRDTESSQLAALVIAQRAVLLYAQSGAGKTSLLQASLVPALKRRKRIVTLPIGRVSGEARGDVANIFVYNTLLNIYGRDARPDELARLTLSQGLAPFMEQEDGRRPRPRLLILDQFEELFTTHAERYADRGEFFSQLGDCLGAYPALSLLLSMREDYIAHLDSFAGQLPDRLRTRFRLERLGAEAALSAVVEPLEGTPRAYAPEVAEALVDNLRRVQRRVRTEAGSDMAYVLAPYVEPVHLQIVCQQLWENLPPGRHLIELDDVQQFGDVDQALTDFYEQALRAAMPAVGMGERRLRRWFDAKLITPAQTRGLLFRGDAETEGLPNPALDILVDRYVVRADIRGGDTWYELSHDRLVEPILVANRAWREAHANPLAVAVEAWQQGGEAESELAQGTQLAELEAYAEEHANDVTANERRFLDESRREEDRRERQAAQRNQRRVVIGALIVVALLVSFSIWALFNADRASSAQATAETNATKASVALATAEANATGASVALATSAANAKRANVAEATAEANSMVAKTEQAVAQQNERRAATSQAIAEAALADSLTQAVSEEQVETAEARQTSLALAQPMPAVANVPPPIAQLGDSWTRPRDKMVMVYVPPPDRPIELESGVDPPLEGYWIDKYEVSNTQYIMCVDAGACEPSDRADDDNFNGANDPVVGISWFDAGDYSAWVGGELPTEGEWEYAAVGVSSKHYPWGNVASCKLANYQGCVGGTKAVDSYPEGASWTEALNMAGNVSEWTASLGDEDPESRVLRGGSWFLEHDKARSVHRSFHNPRFGDLDRGFRVVHHLPS